MALQQTLICVEKPAQIHKQAYSAVQSVWHELKRRRGSEL